MMNFLLSIIDYISDYLSNPEFTLDYLSNLNVPEDTQTTIDYLINNPEILDNVPEDTRFNINQLIEN